MKVKDIINESKRRWAIVGDSNPSVKTKGQTEFTWDNYNKLLEWAKNFDNKEIEFTKLGISEQKGCEKMFQPWGESKEESFWKCGDEWNGEKLLCPKCKKEKKQ